MKVFFTERAYVSVLAETAEKIQTETGGIFLGYRDGENWFVVESIDPGPKSVFQVAYFEYDQKYVNHLSQKIARLYKKPLVLLGLWHRHPGSFDQFSGTDDGTNAKFASLDKEGAISALVNIDPEFRLTIFHVKNPLNYIKVPYCVGDSYVPIEYRAYCETNRLHDYLSAKVDTIWGSIKAKKPRLKYDMILVEILKNIQSLDVSEHVIEEKLPNMSDSDISFVLEEIEKDVNYLGECYCYCKMELLNKAILLSIQQMDRIILNFCVTPSEHRIMFKYEEKYYAYKSGLFSSIIDDVILATKKRRLFFQINREFVECSIQKLKEN